ncbi:MAG: Crp/Fnr family transcriptional regulator [Acidobacteriota bacterium]|nr:Crp/Fnr family transcriptional regulator [Acidobacteriota bacterium]
MAIAELYPPLNRSRQPIVAAFDPLAFLKEVGLRYSSVHVAPGKVFFSQGDSADATFYLEVGRARLNVVSKGGKEATVLLLGRGDFVGEESLVTIPGQRTATAYAVTRCALLRFERKEMIRVLHEEHAFTEMFLKFLLTRAIKSQAHVVDLLFNSCEMRLARILLGMAEIGKPSEIGVLIPKITQLALADMVGTTRSRISHFMNHFRELGYISYDDRIWVRTSLVEVLRNA